MKIDICTVKFEDLELSPRSSEKIRGYIGNKYIENDLFHNHNDNKFIYRYPLVQYKVIKNKPIIIGLLEGTSAVKKLALIEEELIIDDKKLETNQKDIWNLNNLYFKEVKSVTEGKALEEYDKYVDSIKKLELQKIREFELIEDNKFKRDVIIRYNEETEELIKIIENYKEYEEQEVVNAWRGLNKYRISVSWADIKDLVHEIRGTYFLNKEDYDINRGVIKRKHLFL